MLATPCLLRSRGDSRLSSQAKRLLQQSKLPSGRTACNTDVEAVALWPVHGKLQPGHGTAACTTCTRAHRCFTVRKRALVRPVDDALACCHALQQSGMRRQAQVEVLVCRRDRVFSRGWAKPLTPAAAVPAAALSCLSLVQARLSSG